MEQIKSEHIYDSLQNIHQLINDAIIQRLNRLNVTNVVFPVEEQREILYCEEEYIPLLVRAVEVVDREHVQLLLYNPWNDVEKWVHTTKIGCCSHTPVLEALEISCKLKGA